MKILRQNKIFLSIMACLFLLLSAVFITRQYITYGAGDIGENEVNKSAGFADMAAAGADYLNAKLVGYTDMSTRPLNAATAGNLLGYTDSNFVSDNSSSSVIFTVNTHGEGTYQYEALAALNDKGLGSWYIYYANYGRLLNQLGLDQTENNAFGSGLRQAVGIIVTVLYLMTVFVNDFWAIVLTILNIANPFYLFSASTNAVFQKAYTEMDTVAQSNAGNLSGKFADPSALDSIKTGAAAIAGFISDVYDTLQNTAITVFIPLFIATALFVWLVKNKGKKFGSTFKKVIIRVVYVSIGLPLLMSFYTVGLSIVNDIYEVGANIADDVILSNFVDFEDWADTQLKIPPGINDLKFDTSKSRPDITSIKNVRQYCLEINKMINKDKVGVFGADTLTINISDDDLKMTDNEGTYNFNDAILQQLNADERNNVSSTGSKQTGKIVSFLEKYARGDKYSAAAYENHVKAIVSGDFDTPLMFDIVTSLSNHWELLAPDRMFHYISHTPGCLLGIDVSDFTGLINAPSFHYLSSYGFSGYRASLYAGGANDTFVNGLEAIVNIFGFNDSAALRCSGGKYSGGMISCMSMYNYLSSTFDDAQIKVYSAKQTAGNIVKAEHFSVNIVGYSFMSILYLFEVILLFCAFSVIGYGYGFGLLVANFRAMFKMIPYVFTATLGSLRGIATVITMIFMLIMELLATCILYVMATNFIKGLYDIVQQPLATLIGNSFGSLDTTGYLVPLVSSAVSIFVLIFFISKVLEWRYAVCQMITEVLTGFINKLLGTEISAPNINDPVSFGEGVASAAATGAVAVSTVGSAASDAGLMSSEMKNNGAIGYGMSRLSNRSGIADDSATPNYVATGNDSAGADVMSDDEAEKVVASAGGAAPSQRDVSDKSESANSTGNANGNANTSGKNSGIADGSNAVSGSYSETENKLDSTADIKSETTKDITNTRLSDATGSGGVSDNDDNGMNIGSVAESGATANTSSDGQSATGYTFTGSDNATYQLVNAETGNAYTKQDMANGASYSLQNTDTGEVYSDGSMTYSNMDSSTLTVDAEGNIQVLDENNISVITLSKGQSDENTDADYSSGSVIAGKDANPDSGESGTTAIETSASSDKRATIDVHHNNGYTFVGKDNKVYRLVNAQTGATYTEADVRNGNAYSIVNVETNEVYSDDNQSYSDMPVSSLSMDSVGNIDVVGDNGNTVAVMSDGHSDISKSAMQSSIVYTITSDDGNQQAVSVVTLSPEQQNDVGKMPVTNVYSDSKGNTFGQLGTSDMYITKGNNGQDIILQRNHTTVVSGISAEHTAAAGYSLQPIELNAEQQAVVNDMPLGTVYQGSTGESYTQVGDSNVFVTTIGNRTQAYKAEGNFDVNFVDTSAQAQNNSTAATSEVIVVVPNGASPQQTEIFRENIEETIEEDNSQ